MSGKSKADHEAEIERIARRFKNKMAGLGMDVESAGPGKDGTPTISFYVHTQGCASRRKCDCDCREDR